jgi:hypothetical protein
MKVLLLGSTGRVGQFTSELLVKEKLITKIGCASRHMDAARKAAEALGTKGHAVCIDITDITGLTAVATDYDIMLNTAGPTSEVQLPALQAAIAAGIHYCDLGVTGKTTLRAKQLDTAARDHSITAVIDTGWFTTATLLAIYAGQQFLQAEEISVGFQFDYSPGNYFSPEQYLLRYRTSGRMETSWDLIECATEPVPLYRNGSWLDVNPLEQTVRIYHPAGCEIDAYPVDVPFTRTLPGSLPGVKTVYTLLNFNPPALTTLFVEKAQRIARGETDWVGATIDYLETAVQDKDHYLTVPAGHPAGYWMWATAIGVKDGSKVRYTCWPSMFLNWTSVPLVITALRILQGDIQNKGVYTSDAGMTLESFLAETVRYVPEEHRGKPLLHERIDILE